MASGESKSVSNESVGRKLTYYCKFVLPLYLKSVRSLWLLAIYWSHHKYNHIIKRERSET